MCRMKLQIVGNVENKKVEKKSVENEIGKMRVCNGSENGRLDEVAKNLAGNLLGKNEISKKSPLEETLRGFVGC